MSKKTIYINGAVSSIDGQDIEIDEVVPDIIE